MDTQKNDDELRRSFLVGGARFFSWNSGKNTPNILLGLGERIELLQARAKEASDSISALQKTVEQASNSSTKLATALNSFTLALAIIGGFGLILQGVYVGFTVWTYFHK